MHKKIQKNFFNYLWLLLAILLLSSCPSPFPGVTRYTLTFSGDYNGTVTAQLADGSSVSSGDELDGGTVVTLRAAGYSGYELAYYLVGGQPAPGSFTVNGDTEVSAVFHDEGLTFASTAGNAAKMDDYTGSATEVVIPRAKILEGTLYSVTTIVYEAFRDCDSLVSVSIPASVTTIRNYAFLDCGSLTGVTFAGGSTQLGDNVFRGTQLDGVAALGDGLTPTANTYSVNVFWVNDIKYAGIGGEAAVIGNRNVTGNVIIPQTVSNGGASYSVTAIADMVFKDCNPLTSVVIPASVTAIGDAAFENCGSLTSVAIPASVTTIGGGAFVDCGLLASVVIPASVTTIGHQAFGNCDSLTSVTFAGDSTRLLGSLIFSGTPVGDNSANSTVLAVNNTVPQGIYTN